MPHTLIVGSGCGKTHYLLKFLNEKCRKRCENVYVVCPTFSINSTWQGWKFRNDPGVKVLETHDVNRSGEKRSGVNNFRRCCDLKGREIPDERTRKARVFGEASRDRHHCPHTTTNFDRQGLP